MVCCIPTTVKKIMLIIIGGSVVHSILLMWSPSFAPATAGARLVVSENGLSLSPNMAPQITAPATIPGLIPIALPIAIMATPALPAEPYDVPVTRLNTAVKMRVNVSKNAGLMDFKPYTMMVGIVPDAIQVPIRTPIAIKMVIVGRTTFNASKAPSFTCS